jgi:hypothetical protein
VLNLSNYLGVIVHNAISTPKPCRICTPNLEILLEQLRCRVVWPHVFVGLLATRDIVLVPSDHPVAKVFARILLRTSELEDLIHERVEANNDLRNISKCEDAGEHRYGPVLCSREKD